MNRVVLTDQKGSYEFQNDIGELRALHVVGLTCSLDSKSSGDQFKLHSFSSSSPATTCNKYFTTLAHHLGVKQ